MLNKKIIKIIKITKRIFGVVSKLVIISEVIIGWNAVARDEMVRKTMITSIDRL